jgi:nitrite reductase (NO-forming)
MSRASRRAQAQRQARRRRIIAACAAAAVVAVVAAVVLATRGSSGPKTTITVSMTDYAFTPNPIEVTAGDLRINAVNDGQVSHDLVVPELGKGTVDQAPGTSASISFSDLRPGSYLVVCDLPGHRALGMETKLVVRAADGA